MADIICQQRKDHKMKLFITTPTTVSGSKHPPAWRPVFYELIDGFETQTYLDDTSLKNKPYLVRHFQIPNHPEACYENIIFFLFNARRTRQNYTNDDLSCLFTHTNAGSAIKALLIIFSYHRHLIVILIIFTCNIGYS